MNNTMRIKNIAIQPYRIPFVAAFGTARGALPVRDGAIVRMVTNDGLSGLGEIAPLPGFGGTLADALPLLREIVPRLAGRAVADLDALLAALRRQSAAGRVVASGLDLAACDLLAQASGQPLAAWLSADQSVAYDIPVNATLGASTPAELAREAERAITAGFGCVKLKVGAAPSLADDVARVAAVRHAIGATVELRLDANGAWSVDQALRLMDAVQPYGIDLIEQPVAALNDLVRIRAGCPRLRIAADELVIDLDAARRIIEKHAADVLVVKPMVVGGPRVAYDIVRLAEAAGLGVIVTSVLESGVGVAGALHVAATLRTPLACGLATTALLASDLLAEPLAVHAGRMALPQAPGLGARLDQAQLDKLRLHI